MDQSAFLPDAEVLNALLGSIKAPPGKSLQDAVILNGIDRDARPTLTDAPATLTLPPPTQVRVLDNSSWVTTLLGELETRLTHAHTLDARFLVFARWLEERTGAESVFVADAEGLDMVQSAAGETYVAAAAAIDTLRRDLAGLIPNVESGRTTLRPSSGSHVELIWCETELGRYTVGLVLAEPLGPAWTDAVPTALRDIVTAHQNRG